MQRQKFNAGQHRRLETEAVVDKLWGENNGVQLDIFKKANVSYLQTFW